MTDHDAALHDLLAARTRGVLTTLRADGRPQLSNVLYHYDPGTRLARVSVTGDRAKTRNLRRDPRAALHTTSDDFWSYAVADGTVTLTGPAADPGDAAADALVALYRDLRGEHPDWDEYRAAMVADHRVLLTLTVDHVYGAAR